MNSFFFPNQEYLFRVIPIFCYVLILINAYRRYNALAVEYGTYDAPDTARPWTTWLRFHFSAVIYFFIFACLFTALFRLFLLYPKLLHWFFEAYGSEPKDKFFTALNHDPKVSAPIAAMFLVTWGFQRFSKCVELDLSMRRFFQRLGSIPIQVSRTISSLKRANLSMDVNAMIKNMPEEVKCEILLRAKPDEERSLESMYLRACFLESKISEWNSPSSEFYHFKTVFRRQYESIRRAYSKVDMEIERYYDLLLKLNSFQKLRDQLTDCSFINEVLALEKQIPKLIKEHRRDVREDLKNFLENIYTFIACAVHSERKIERSRRKLLETLGFRFNDSNEQKGFWDPNDFAVLSIYLIFIIPVAAILCCLTNQKILTYKGYEIMIIWSPMATLVGLATAGSALFVKKHMDSRCSIFHFLKPRIGRSWCAYGLAGLIAGTLSILLLVLWSYLSAANVDETLFARLKEYWEWSFVPFGIASITGYHLDRSLPDKTLYRIFETLTTALTAIIAAVFSLITIQGQFSLGVVTEGSNFVLPAAALMGLWVGLIIPHRYRYHLSKKLQLKKRKLPISKIIKESLGEFSNRAEGEGVRIISKIDDTTPDIDVDEAKMKQAIDGLLSNALENTHEGGQIEIHVFPGDNGSIGIKIEDNGIGIKKEQLKKIREMMVPEKEDATVSYDDISKSRPANLRQISSILKHHHGFLDLESIEKSGTVAYIQMPVHST